MYNTIDIDELRYIMDEIKDRKHPKSKMIHRFIIEVLDYLQHEYNVDEY